MRKKIVFTEEAKFTLLFFLSILVLVLVMAVVSYFFQDSQIANGEKDNQNTVVIMQAKKEKAPQTNATQTVVSSVRDAISKGNSSTQYVQINNENHNSSEHNKELKNAIDDETKKRKAGGVRKESTNSKNILRYIDESTPRDRSSDAAYVYFVDVSGLLIPRFCVQIALKQHLLMTEFTITADSKTMRFNVPSYQSENIKKGVAEWYDVPLDKDGYRAVQAIMKAKKTVLTVSGMKGKVSRDLAEDEVKAFRRILDSYTALGGRLNSLQVDKVK